MTYSVQIDGLVRDATAAETKAIDADRAQFVADKEAEAEAQTAKDAARQAVLDKLGLTQDEAEALLG
jgi:hypothetical protein